MSGVPLIATKELMGHSDIKTTLIYAHLAPNIKQEAVELLTKGASNSKIIGRISAWTLFRTSETVTNCHGLKMEAADGKMILTDVANTEQLL
jgi:hypothetical protein